MAAPVLEPETLFLLVCREACLDAVLEEEEKRCVQDLQRFLKIPAGRARVLFLRAREKAAEARRVGMRPLDRHALFRSACWHAWADGEITREERRLVMGLAQYLHLDAETARSLFESARPGVGLPPPGARPRPARRPAAQEGRDLNAEGERLLAAGTSEAHDRAMALFHRAAADGEAAGWVNLGRMYLEGLGVGVDRDLATRFFRLAADAGEPRGRELLARIDPLATGSA